MDAWHDIQLTLASSSKNELLGPSDIKLGSHWRLMWLRHGGLRPNVWDTLTAWWLRHKDRLHPPQRTAPIIVAVSYVE